MKKTKQQKIKNSHKRHIDHLNSVTGGMAAILSAYLLALSVRLVALEGYHLQACILSAPSLVFLVMYKIGSHYEKENEINNSTPLGILFVFGLLGSLGSYFFILAAINIYIAVIAYSTFVVAIFLLWLSARDKS